MEVAQQQGEKGQGVEAKRVKTEAELKQECLLALQQTYCPAPKQKKNEQSQQQKQQQKQLQQVAKAPKAPKAPKAEAQVKQECVVALQQTYRTTPKQKQQPTKPSSHQTAAGDIIILDDDDDDDDDVMIIGSSSSSSSSSSAGGGGSQTTTPCKRPKQELSQVNLANRFSSHTTASATTKKRPTSNAAASAPAHPAKRCAQQNNNTPPAGTHSAIANGAVHARAPSAMARERAKLDRYEMKRATLRNSVHISLVDTMPDCGACLAHLKIHYCDKKQAHFRAVREAAHAHHASRCQVYLRGATINAYELGGTEAAEAVLSESKRAKQHVPEAVLGHITCCVRL